MFAAELEKHSAEDPEINAAKNALKVEFRRPATECQIRFDALRNIQSEQTRLHAFLGACGGPFLTQTPPHGFCWSLFDLELTVGLFSTRQARFMPNMSMPKPAAPPAEEGLD